jgi:hypothetical protein
VVLLTARSCFQKFKFCFQKILVLALWHGRIEVKGRLQEVPKGDN